MPDSGNEVAIPPPVLWAQRKNAVLLTILVEDCKKPNITLEANKLIFSGKGGMEGKLYEITLEFFKEIVPEDSKQDIRDRMIEFWLKKKEIDDTFWKRLLKDDKKYHWLKVDFNKWKDEDDTDDEQGGGGGDQPDLEEVMKQMGGLGGAGGQPPNLDDLDLGNEEDSDDEGLPDLE